MKLLIYFLVFAFVGVAQEVFWRGILDTIKKPNKRLKGSSSLWMFLIYGAILFIVIFVTTFFSKYPWWIHGLLYSGIITAWEYTSGFTIRALTGIAPWDYSTNKSKDGIARKKKYNFDGLICLEYLPVWFIWGLIAEWGYLFLQSHLIL